MVAVCSPMTRPEDLFVMHCDFGVQLAMADRVCLSVEAIEVATVLATSLSWSPSLVFLSPMELFLTVRF